MHTGCSAGYCARCGGDIEEWEVCQAIVWRNHLIEEFGQAGPELGPAGEPVLLDTG